MALTLADRRIPLFATRESLVPLWGRIADRQRAVLESGRYILGPEVEAFEAEFAAHLGRRHCIGVANGTDAITIGLRALGVAAGGFMATIHLLEPMVDGQFALFADSWRQAVIVYGLLLAATLLFLRGRANAPRELLMIALLGLPSIWIGGVSGAMLANQYLDPSPPQMVRVVLLHHYLSKGKNTSYHFVFAAWRRGGADVNIVVPHEIYRKARRNQTWLLETRAGRFGYEWIDSLEPLPKT